ncbi:MAG TPA: cupin domain-containing protein [Candidatus Krumholzibacteria bacterium]|nr:cupin domain-containing protein [Candidatus Krumholzibacteria bacterium]
MSSNIRSLFAGVPGDLAAQPELIERLAAQGAMRVERIVSRGHVSPPGFWYDQVESEWVLLVTGRARLYIENQGMVELAPGDHLTIPPHVRHRVEWTDPDADTVWVAVFY